MSGRHVFEMQELHYKYGTSHDLDPLSLSRLRVGEDA